MGIGRSEAEFLTAAAQVGVSFDRTLTLGRQSLTMRRDELGVVAPGVTPGYAEALLERLGATSVESMDATDYEGATIVHDLNEPVAAAMDEQFTVVIDSGTIEHVFNAAEALRSGMRMVETGGHLVMMTPCNGAPGHGFYQFSPELVHRVFSPANGYEMRRCMLREHRGRWYDVADPAGARCEFRTKQTAYLFVVAQRVVAGPIFERWPQQSDYAVSGPVTRCRGDRRRCRRAWWTVSRRASGVRCCDSARGRGRRATSRGRASSRPPNWSADQSERMPESRRASR